MIFNGFSFWSLFPGVSHAEELQYLFPIAESLFISALPTKECEEIRKGITQLWVDFARTGYKRISFPFNQLLDS